MPSTPDAIFRSFTREDLDAHYNNRLKVPTFERYVAGWKNYTQLARQRWHVTTNIDYGAGEHDKLDVYVPLDEKVSNKRRPCHIFFHGGYWFSMSKNDFGYVANGLCPHDFCTIVVDYELIPSTTMAELIDQCRRSVQWVYRNAAQLNIDASRIQISGHSAGGHIVGMLMATDWRQLDAALPETPLQSACSLSGLFDLEPIALSYLNDTLHLTDAEVAEFSPVRHSCLTKAKLNLLVGELEGSEYERQSKDLYDAWTSVLPEANYQSLAGHDHFSIVDALNDPESDVIKAFINFRDTYDGQ